MAATEKKLKWIAATVVVTAAIACGASVSPNNSDAGADTDAAPGDICHSTKDCAADQFCDMSGACAGEGTCKLVPTGCPVGGEEVCSCNGLNEPDPCLAGFFEKVGVAYGGDCRKNVVRSCHAATDCASDEVCAVDAQSCDGGSSCVGYCLTATDIGGGPFPCDDTNCNARPSTSVCVRTACVDGGSFACTDIVFSSALNCDASADCPSGQVCLSPSASAGPCQRTCVVP